MNDPTIYDDLNILKGIETFEESKSEARLKSEKNLCFFIITINMNGPPKGKGTAEKRRKSLSVILQQFPSAIIFCQELPGYFKEEVVPDGYDFHRTVNNEAAIMWPSKLFEGSYVTSDKEVLNIHNKTLPETGGAELLSRMIMVKLTTRQEPITSTLAVSYHGEHRIELEEEKKAIFQSLLTFLHKVIKTNDICSFILGGDFNFNTLDVYFTPDVAVQSYNLTARSDEGNKIRYKDNFFSFPYGTIEVRWLRAMEIDNTTASDLSETDFEVLENYYATINDAETKITDLLDHDPLVGVLVFLKEKAVDEQINAENSSTR